MTEQQQTGGTDLGDGADTGDEQIDDVLDEGAEETGDGQDAEQWTAPTREEWDAQQAKLKRANEQARKLREKTRATAPAAAAPDAGAAAAAAGDVEKWQGRAVRQAAKAELLQRGADPEMVDLALGRLRVAEVDFDDDEPDLADWLDEMEERYPKLFAKPAPAPAPAAAPRPGRVNQAAAAAGRPVRPQMSLGEQVLANSEAARRGAGGRRS